MSLIELYPESGVERELQGLHLADDVRGRPRPSGSYVYTGYITSNDGRIAREASYGAPWASRNPPSVRVVRVRRISG